MSDRVPYLEEWLVGIFVPGESRSAINPFWNSNTGRPGAAISDRDIGWQINADNIPYSHLSNAVSAAT
jgi:hypothetical protein